MQCHFSPRSSQPSCGINVEWSSSLADGINSAANPLSCGLTGPDAVAIVLIGLLWAAAEVDEPCAGVAGGVGLSFVLPAGLDATLSVGSVTSGWPAST